MADQAIETSRAIGERSAGTTTSTGPAVIGEMLSDASLGARRFEAASGTAFYEADAPARALFFIHDGQVRIFQVGPLRQAQDKPVRQAQDRPVRPPQDATVRPAQDAPIRPAQDAPIRPPQDAPIRPAQDRPSGQKVSTQLVEILGPGDWFGIPALARGEDPRYGMRAVAVTPATVSEVPAERLLAALPAQPGVARELISQLASKLQAAYGHSANLVFDDTEKRLIKALLQFSRTSAAAPIEGEEGEGGVVLRITHQQLAQAVGAARETVSLTLTQLRQQNLLRTGRNRLLFNPQALEDFSRRSEGAAAPSASEKTES